MNYVAVVQIKTDPEKVEPAFTRFNAVLLATVAEEGGILPYGPIEMCVRLYARLAEQALQLLHAGDRVLIAGDYTCPDDRPDLLGVQVTRLDGCTQITHFAPNWPRAAQPITA